MAFFTILFMALTLIPFSLSQPSPPSPPPPAEAPAPSSDSCNGVFLSYTHTATTQLPPNLLKSDPARQPYRFDSTLTVLNNGLDELKSWRAFVGFRHGESLISAAGAVLADGTTLPADVSNGTLFAGFPTSDLKTAVETAGDLTQMEVQVKLVGVQYGVAPPAVPMPANISLANDGFICPRPTLQGTSRMEVCCTMDPAFKSNITLGEEFLPRQNGDLSIMYDVIRTYDSSYWAQVTIANHDPLGRLDYWKLSWQWMNGEFIYSMIGAYPAVVDSTECIFGDQGQHYKDLDFANVLNCERRPTLIDLPLTMYNDTKLGFKPYCCRNGTILPPLMDNSKSISAFQLQVFKMPPELNRSQLTPPQNWQINGTKLNPDYKCGPPIRVSPSESPDSSGLPLNSTAVASWQVVCNITQPKNASPKCCVSFSAYYNDSVLPCNTCACGCSRSTTDRTCSTSAPAMLLPPEALLVPFENRTAKALAWAQLKRLPVPNPMPCGDNCGVSLNWHILSDYSKGWTARITIFNWDETAYPDWFAAVQMNKAVPGFEKMYSFNGSTLELNGVNNTLFMQGLPGLNFIVAETDGANPEKDPRVPGKQQTVISFTKKHTPGINVPQGDGFPTKVFFNGEECSLPSVFPSNGVAKNSATLSSVVLVLVLAASIFLW